MISENINSVGLRERFLVEEIILFGSIVAPQHIEVGQKVRNSAHLACQELARNLPHSQMDDNEFEPGNRFSPLPKRAFTFSPFFYQGVSIFAEFGALLFKTRLYQVRQKICLFPVRQNKNCSFLNNLCSLKGIFGYFSNKKQ